MSSEGSWHAQGEQGATARAGMALAWDQRYSGSASGGSGSWTASSPYGATAYHNNNNYYGGSYSTYRKRSLFPTLRSAGRAGEGCGLVPGLLVRA